MRSTKLRERFFKTLGVEQLSTAEEARLRLLALHRRSGPRVDAGGMSRRCEGERARNGERSKRVTHQMPSGS